MEVAKALRANDFATTELEALRMERSAVPYSDLMALLQQRGYTSTAAEDIMSRLERAGALLTLKGTVLLRPGEVAQALSLVLPSSSDTTQKRLAAAQCDLQQLDGQQAAIGRKAARRRWMLVWGGLTSQLALWGVLFHLTFYELSWDVMEPRCFFVSGAQAMLCYAYFMTTRKEFTWESAFDRNVRRWEVKQLQRIGFDMKRYRHLKAEVQQLTELLQAQQQGSNAG